MEYLFCSLKDSSDSGKMAIDIIFLIGLVPQGLYHEDLTRMLECDIEPSLVILVDSNLI
jgi:hypothetical protein